MERPDDATAESAERGVSPTTSLALLLAITAVLALAVALFVFAGP